jgi:SAM-dependent methyltransferase
MESETEIKKQVRKFYDQVGWQQVSEGVYQNARYEDLRPVAREYINRCHMRVKRHVEPSGELFLDAGSGPIQYPEYLTYSESYQHRVCLDVSIVALQEARQRIGKHGLFVVGDITRLPFMEECFDGIVTLHTIHHVPFEQQPDAYQDLYRILKSGKTAVLVNGWDNSRLMNDLEWLIKGMQVFLKITRRLMFWKHNPITQKEAMVGVKPGPTKTYTRHFAAATLTEVLTQRDIPVEIRVWRSVSTRFLRAVIHPMLAGKLWLRLLFWLEERFPHFFGKYGQYPLIIVRKTQAG